MRHVITGLVYAALAAICLFVPNKGVGAEAPSTALIKNIEGVYKSRFENGLVSGETYQSEDIIEIVRYSPETIYFRVSLQFFNGHTCGLSGIAKYVDEAFVYKSEVSSPEQRACTLKISAKKDVLHITDRVNADSASTCREYCGIRGSLGDYSIDRSKKRKIRYLPIVLKSRQYIDAVEEFKRSGDDKRD